MNFAGINTTASGLENFYRYNGKELQKDLELNWYDYGARFYDAQIGRWHSVDNLAEKYYHQTPYMYAGNNPIILVDYDGNDYGFTIDHKNKTLTISATFYTPDGVTNNKAAQDWNSYTGTYTTKDGVEYDVVFSLSVEHTESHMTTTVAENDATGNSITENSNDQAFEKVYKIRGGKENAKDVGGYNAGEKHIENRSSKATTQSRSHEMGHSLLQKDGSGGNMNYASSLGKMSSVTKGNAKSVVKNSLKIAKKDAKGKSNSHVQVNTKGTYNGNKSFYKGKLEIKKW